MIDRLKRLLEIRFRISTQLYFGFGVAVALTIGASLVGWFSFNQVGDAQSRVNEGSVPELAAAFGVAQYSGELVNAAPRLSAAETRPSFARVVSSIDESRAAFEEQLTGLEGSEADERFDRIGEDAETLFSNIEAIKQDRLTLFKLADKKAALRTEIEKLTVQLNDYLGPAIDDQLFYTVTGYRELGEPPAPRSEHFSEEEVERYRHLAELQVDVNIATQLLADAFGVSDASLVEPLRERFESAAGRIERNLSTQSAVSLPNEMVPVLARLFELGGLEIRLPESLAKFVVGVGGAAEQQSGFDLIDQELRLADRRQDLLNDNRNLAVTLLSEVNGLVSAGRGQCAGSHRRLDAGDHDGPDAPPRNQRNQYRRRGAHYLGARRPSVAAPARNALGLDASHGRRRPGGARRNRRPGRGRRHGGRARSFPPPRAGSAAPQPRGEAGGGVAGKERRARNGAGRPATGAGPDCRTGGNSRPSVSSPRAWPTRSRTR